MTLSVLTLSIGCGQKKDNEEASSQDNTSSVKKEQVSKASNQNNKSAPPQRPPVSIPAPEFTLATTDGDLVSFSMENVPVIDLKRKKIVVKFQTEL